MTNPLPPFIRFGPRPASHSEETRPRPITRRSFLAGAAAAVPAAYSLTLHGCAPGPVPEAPHLPYGFGIRRVDQRSAIHLNYSLALLSSWPCGCASAYGSPTAISSTSKINTWLARRPRSP